MTNNPQKETFTYTYSAKQQEEIDKIRKKYETPKENKLEQLRRLDASVTKKASIHSMLVAIIGALIMGTGMSLIMTNLNIILGLSKRIAIILGIGIGIFGIILICCAYPIFTHTLAKEREHIAPEILKLIDEMMN